MSIAIRTNILKEALEDPETRLKIDCAITWKEIRDILSEFAKKKGFTVVHLNRESKRD